MTSEIPTSWIPIPIQARENPYIKYVTKDGHSCATCYIPNDKNLSIKCVECQRCIWWPELPNYKPMLKLTNHRLDDYPGFTVFFER